VYVKITWVQEFLIRNREVMAVTLDEIDAVSRLCGTFGDSVWMRGLTLPWRILIVPTRKSLKRGRTTLRIKRQCTEPGIRRAGALHWELLMTRFARRGLQAGFAVMMLLPWAARNSAQATQPNTQGHKFRQIEATKGQLRIEAPEMVHPGETLVIRVTSPEKVPFTLIGLIGESPLGISDLAKSLPAEFSYEIPKDISCHKYLITVDAVVDSTNANMTTHIEVDVEPAELPVRLEPNIPQLYSLEVGSEFPLIISGEFKDGTCLDLRWSTYVKYISTDTRVATVDWQGQVMGVAPGRTTIRIVYGLDERKRELLVPVSVAPAMKMPERRFNIAVSPGTVELEAGKSCRFDISLSPVESFSGDVTLQFNGFIGATAKFTPARIEAASGMSTLIVTIDSSMPPGKYEARVTGWSGEFYESAAVKIEVVAQ